MRSAGLAAALAFVSPCLGQAPALRGFDAIALAKGKEEAGSAEFVVDRGGQRYLFASAPNRETFLADPERHEIQLGGACARMGPLSGGGDAHRWHVHGERIYVFASDQCREGFKKRPDAYLPIELPAPADGVALTAGEALLGRAVKAHGGAERLRAWTSYRHERQATDAAGKTTEAWRIAVQLPASARLEHDYHQGDRVWRYAQIVAPAGDLFVDEGKVREMSKPASREMHEDLGHEPLLALRWALDGKAVIASAGRREVAGIAVDELVVWRDGRSTTFGLDADGRVRTARCRGRGPGLWFGDLELVFDDFATVGGLVLPATVRATFDGKDAPTLHQRRTGIAVDEPIDAAVFRAPNPPNAPK